MPIGSLRMDRWTDGQTSGKLAHTDFKSVLSDLSGRTNESPPVFYRTSSPSGLLPCTPSFKFIIVQSRATGITDHILPMGNWFSLIGYLGPT